MGLFACPSFVRGTGSGNNTTLIHGNTTTGGGLLAPTVLTISASLPLAVTSTLAKTSSFPGAPGPDPGVDAAAPGGAGSSASAAPGLTTSFLAVSGSPKTVTGSTVAANDATSVFTSTITVTATWPSGATPACSIQSPFASAAAPGSCAIPTFNVASGNLTSTGNFTVKAYASNGGATDFLLSNSLPVTGYGIRQISDASPGAADQLQSDSIVYKGKLYFSTLLDLFSYNSVTDTVTQIENMNGGNTEASTLSVDTVGNLLNYYSENTHAAFKFYTWDDIGPTVTNVINTSGIGNSDGPGGVHFPVYCGGRSYYWLQKSAAVFKVYELNPPNTVTQISNTKGGLTDGNAIETMFCLNSKVYFTIYQPATTAEALYVYDPAVGAASFNQVSLLDATGDQIWAPLGVIGGTKALLYAANAGGNNTLFTFDGTTWTNIANITGGGDIDNGFPMNNISATLSSGKIFFPMMNASSKYKLYSYQDSPQTLVQLTNINAAGVDDVDANANHAFYIIAYNGKIFFTGKNAGKLKLYRWDDSAQTLTQITNTAGTGNNDFSTAAPPNSDPLFTIYNNKLFFRANINAAGVVNKYFMYDDVAGTLVQLTNIGGATHADSPWTVNLPLVPSVYNNRLYFAGFDASAFDKLYSLCDPATGCTP
ncbi:MAG: hypothetical protein ACXWOH_04600 [Bdellovibrionota bacterium]